MSRLQRREASNAEARALAEKHAAERRQRESAASAQARDALSKLLLLDRDPDFDRRVQEYSRIRSGTYDPWEEADEADEVAMVPWRQLRDTLVMAVDSAASDLSDYELRQRLDEVCDILRLYYGAEKYAHQMEPRTRHIAARHGFDCLAAFRRGDPLPERSEDYQNTHGLDLVYLDELEANSRRS